MLGQSDISVTAVLMSISAVRAGDSWSFRNATSPITYTDSYDITFNGDDAWVVGENGGVLHSTNRGVTWVPETGCVTANLYSVIMNNTTKFGAMVGAAGNMSCLTHDAGANWYPIALKNASHEVLNGLAHWTTPR